MADEGSDRRRGWLWAGLALLALLVFYVLSVGPAVMMVEKTGVGGEVGEVAYAPLKWLRDNTPLEKPLDAYVDFWAGLAGGLSARPPMPPPP